MTDQPPDDIDEFMDELRAWAAGTQQFARKIQALSLLQRSRAVELRIEAEEIVYHIRTRRHTEQDLREQVRAFRTPRPCAAPQPTERGRSTEPGTNRELLPTHHRRLDF